MEIGTLLDKDETAVFKACYDNSPEKESNIIDVREATRTIVEGGLSTEQIQDCLEIILKRHLFNEYVGKSGSRRISTIQTNTYGFILYANAFIPEIDRLRADVLDAVVHRGLKSHKEGGAHLGISKFLVSYIFDILKEQGCIQTVKAMGDVHEVQLITAEGRKAAGKPALDKQNEPSFKEIVEDLVDTIDVSEKANKRNRVLLRVYQESKGNPSISVSDDIIVEKEGVTHEELMQEIQPYLQKRGLIKFQGFKATAIDDAGIDKVERELLGQPKWTVEARATSEKVDLSFIADARIKTIVERDYAELQMLKQLTKQLLERAMAAEMTEHVGYDKHDAAGNNSGNSRNGKSAKTIKGSFGTMPLEVPRDRNGTFEPQIIEKHQTRFTGFDENIISLYARGLSTREIQQHIEEMYHVEVSPALISSVT